jgi:hypothetical protein
LVAREQPGNTDLGAEFAAGQDGRGRHPVAPIQGEWASKSQVIATVIREPPGRLRLMARHSCSAWWQPGADG